MLPTSKEASHSYMEEELCFEESTPQPCDLQRAHTATVPVMPREPIGRQSPGGAPMEMALCAATEWSLLVAAVKLLYVESDRLSHFLYICIYKSDRQWNGLPEAVGFERHSPQPCYLSIYLSTYFFIYLPRTGLLRRPFCLHPITQQYCTVPAHDLGLLGRVLDALCGVAYIGRDTSASSLRSTWVPPISRSASQAAVTPRCLLEDTGWGSNELTS